MWIWLSVQRIEINSCIFSTALLCRLLATLMIQWATAIKIHSRLLNLSIVLCSFRFILSFFFSLAACLPIYFLNKIFFSRARSFIKILCNCLLLFDCVRCLIFLFSSFCFFIKSHIRKRQQPKAPNIDNFVLLESICSWSIGQPENTNTQIQLIG